MLLVTKIKLQAMYQIIRMQQRVSRCANAAEQAASRLKVDVDGRFVRSADEAARVRDQLRLRCIMEVLVFREERVARRGLGEEYRHLEVICGTTPTPGLRSVNRTLHETLFSRAGE